MAAIEEYAIEASIMKVAGSEWMFEIIDDMLQVHGGNGFVTDYPIEAIYRDNRVNRIFEGTNEINRLLIPGMLLKRAMKGNCRCWPPRKSFKKRFSLDRPSMKRMIRRSRQSISWSRTRRRWRSWS